MTRPKKIPPHVKDAIGQAARGGIREPQLAELAGHFITKVGGMRALAGLLAEEFRAAQPGSVVRQRILDMILRALKFANERSGPGDDLSLMEEGEIERNLEGLLGEILDDGQEDQTPDQPGAGPQPPA